jgi:hypothetical protein
MQILTSDFEACPADILSWLRSRWHEENFLKYASENYGIDKICDYAATIETNTKITDNPARRTCGCRQCRHFTRPANTRGSGLGQITPSQTDSQPPEPINLTEHRICRKKILGGLTHEYYVAA